MEEVLDDNANRPIRRRFVCCLLRQFVVLLPSRIFSTLTLWCLAYSYYASTRLPFLPKFGSCSGTELSALFGCALLSSYLVLFIEFYMRTYKQPVKGKKVANGKANSAANGYVLSPESRHFADCA